MAEAAHRLAEDQECVACHRRAARAAPETNMVLRPAARAAAHKAHCVGVCSLVLQAAGGMSSLSPVTLGSATTRRRRWTLSSKTTEERWSTGTKIWRNR